MNILEVQSLTKTYRHIPALRSITLQVPEGIRYGILGAAGSGKTTLLHTLLGFLKPTSGSIRVCGTTNLEAARARIGYIPSRFRYHRSYTPQEYLFFLGQFSDIEQATLSQRIGELLELVGLSTVATKALTTFSPGMLQRFGIAQALLGKPDLLLIDDLTYGLDAVARKDLLDTLQHTISQDGQHGMTMVICSQNSDDIEQLCDYAGILVDGYLIEQLVIQDIQRSKNCLYIQVDQLGPEVQEALRQISPLIQCHDHTITLHPNNQWLQEAVLRALLDAKVTIISMETPDRILYEYYTEKVQAFLRMQSQARSQGIPMNEQPAFYQPTIAASSIMHQTEQRSFSHLVPTEETDALLSELLKSSQPPDFHPAPLSPSNPVPSSHQESG